MTSNEDKRKLTDLSNESAEKELEWVKQCLSIIAIVLGLVIGLKTERSDSMCEYIAFISALSIGGLCLLFGIFLLYSGHDTLYRLSLAYSTYIHRKVDYTNGDNEVSVNPRKIFGVLRVCFFVLLILSILSLIVLSAISSFPVLMQVS
jgi:hypothetical protein